MSAIFDELGQLTLATALFILLHTVVSSTGLRRLLVNVLGETPYLGLFSLAVLGALVWMSMAYSAAPTEVLWVGPRYLALAVMPFAFLLLASGIGLRNPGAVGQDGMPLAGEARGILRITRHPVQWGILLWSAAHLLANGDSAALIFFGGFLLLSAVGPLLIDRKRAASMGEDWRVFVKQTSNLPFAAILAGRNRFAPAELGWKRPLVALALYLALVSLHPLLFGFRAY